MYGNYSIRTEDGETLITRGLLTVESKEEGTKAMMDIAQRFSLQRGEMVLWTVSYSNGEWDSELV